MGDTKSVLVTGSAGRIGEFVWKEIESRGHRVRGFDLCATPGLEDSVVGNLTDVPALEGAMEAVDTVVHLAATPDVADFMTDLLPNNIVGLYNILEGARKTETVKNVVLASSVQVVWGHEGPFPITEEMPYSPRNWYGSAKVLSEAAGRFYAHEHALQVICVRPGWCPRSQEHIDILRSNWHDSQDFYFSPADAGRCFACAAEAELNVPFCAVFGCSQWVHKPYLDLSRAKEMIGYEPEDVWPAGIEVVQDQAEA